MTHYFRSTFFCLFQVDKNKMTVNLFITNEDYVQLFGWWTLKIFMKTFLIEGIVLGKGINTSDEWIY